MKNVSRILINLSHEEQFALCCELNTVDHTILAREPQRYTVSSQQWWKQMAKRSENTGALRDKREQEKLHKRIEKG